MLFRSVDWAGKTAAIVSNETGEIIPVYIFVGVLSHSLYAYVEGFLAQDQECWIAAHVNMYRFFGGVTKILVPDNLKTGVEKSDWCSPDINKAYQEMAEHYDTAVVPARVRKPRDYLQNWIIFRNRNISSNSTNFQAKIEDNN